MTSTVRPASSALENPSPRPARIQGTGRSSDLATVVVLGACAVMAGVYWDISWHMSIGRDTFWSPPHLLIQAGGLIAGLSSGFIALRTTFRGSEADRQAGVNVWGFRAPLGAWVCIWGCAAMVISAPFDNWWHYAYGLDVRIVSPPHVVLALGIYAICWGALLLTLARQNRTEGSEQRGYAHLYIVAAGLLVMNFAIFLTEYSVRWMQHSGGFYRISAIFYPFALVVAARASRLRWAATLAAAVYMGVMLALMWFIQLIPATPKLGPIYQPITNMVGLAFPLWLIAPGFTIDLIRHRVQDRIPAPALAIAFGAAFVGAFIAVQWPFATFLVESPAARNWFFNADNFVYWSPQSYVERSRVFLQPSPGGPSLGWHLGVAVAYASVSSWVGLLWGTWMTRIQR